MHDVVKAGRRNHLHHLHTAEQLRALPGLPAAFAKLSRMALGLGSGDAVPQPPGGWPTAEVAAKGAAIPSQSGRRARISTEPRHQ
jgi:hypothetical protein